MVDLTTMVLKIVVSMTIGCENTDRKTWYCMRGQCHNIDGGTKERLGRGRSAIVDALFFVTSVCFMSFFLSSAYHSSSVPEKKNLCYNEIYVFIIRNVNYGLGNVFRVSIINGMQTISVE